MTRAGGKKVDRVDLKEPTKSCNFLIDEKSNVIKMEYTMHLHHIMAAQAHKYNSSQTFHTHTYCQLIELVF